MDQIIVGNTHKLVSPDNHSFKVYVKNVHGKDIIRNVQIFLHPTFKKNSFSFTEPPYEVNAAGWGEFDVLVLVTTKNNTRHRIVYPLQFKEDDIFKVYNIGDEEKLNKLNFIEKKVEIGNTHKELGEGKHSWKLYVRCEDYSIFEKVEIFLHPSFPNNHFVIEDPKEEIELASIGWGTFPIKIRFHLINNTVQEVTHNLQFLKPDQSSTRLIRFKDVNKRMKTKISNFPIDCIGEIMCYNRSSRVANNVLMLSKAVKFYVEREYPKCFRYVVYRWKGLPKKDMWHVVTLFIPSNKKLTKSSFKKFPNLNSLCVEDGRNFKKGVMNKVNPNIEEICVINIKRGDLNVFSRFKKLKRFEIRNCMKFATPNQSTLIELIVDNNNIKNIDFQHLSNLKRLQILNCPKVTDDVFQYLPKLKHLEINGCQSFKPDGFKDLKKLETLIIKRCDNLKGGQKEFEDLIKVRLNEFNNDYLSRHSVPLLNLAMETPMEAPMNFHPPTEAPMNFHPPTEAPLGHVNYHPPMQAPMNFHPPTEATVRHMNFNNPPMQAPIRRNVFPVNGRKKGFFDRLYL